MWPILFKIDWLGVIVPSHAVMLAFSVLLGCLLVPIAARHFEGLATKRVYCATVLLAIAAVVGARAHYVAIRWSWYSQFPWDSFRLTYTGYHAVGGILGVVVALPLVVRALNVPAGRLADATVLVGGISVAVARLGCFLNGCCFGSVCDHAWCLAYPIGSAAYSTHRTLHILESGARQSLAVHPLALYFAVAGLAVSVVAYVRYQNKRYDGQVALYGAATFSATTAAIEALRQPLTSDVEWAGVDQRFWLAIAASVLFVTLIAARERSWLPSSWQGRTLKEAADA